MKKRIIIGIPYIVFLNRYGILLKYFFQNQNCKVITNKKYDIISKGSNTCIPYQKYIEDIEFLKEKCDYVIILKYNKSNLCCLSKINETNNRQLLEIKIPNKYIFISLFKIGIKVSKNIPKMIYSYIKAIKKQKNYILNKENYQKHLLLKNNKKILLLSPFYILEDKELVTNIITIIKKNDLIPVYSSRINKKNIDVFSEYYQKNIKDILLKEILGAYYFYKDSIDGIIYIYSCNCEINNIIKNTTFLKDNTLPLININIYNYEEKTIKEFIKKII